MLQAGIYINISHLYFSLAKKQTILHQVLYLHFITLKTKLLSNQLIFEFRNIPVVSNKLCRANEKRRSGQPNFEKINNWGYVYKIFLYFQQDKNF